MFTVSILSHLKALCGSKTSFSIIEGIANNANSKISFHFPCRRLRCKRLGLLFAISRLKIEEFWRVERAVFPCLFFLSILKFVPINFGTMSNFLFRIIRWSAVLPGTKYPFLILGSDKNGTLKMFITIYRIRSWM